MSNKHAHFSILNTSELQVDPPVFNCDQVISKNIAEPLPNTAFFMSIIGSAGSGKTSILLNMLSKKEMYRQAFDAVHVVIPPSSIGSMKNNIFEGHRRMYEDLTIDVLEHIVNEAKDMAEDKENSLIVIDDFAAALKDKEIQRTFFDMIVNRRHYRLSIIILVQTYSALPLRIRKTLSHFITFKPRNRKETKNIWEELIQIPQKDADDLMRFVFHDGPYNFLMAETATNRFFKNFDEISVKADDDYNPEVQEPPEDKTEEEK